MRIETQFEDPNASRLSVSDANGETVIVIPPVRNYFIMVFMTAWLRGWTIGGVAAMQAFLNGGGDSSGRAFLGFWLFGWLVGEVTATGMLLWLFFGREVATATPLMLTLSRHVLLWSRKRHYRPDSVANLRWEPEQATWARHGRKSRISFEYGPKTVSFANGCDAGEGRHIIASLGRRLGLKRDERR